MTTSGDSEAAAKAWAEREGRMIELMCRELCEMMGENPDDPIHRGSDLPNWRHYEDECREFSMFYRAMIEAERKVTTDVSNW